MSDLIDSEPFIENDMDNQFPTDHVAMDQYGKKDLTENMSKLIKFVNDKKIRDNYVYKFWYGDFLEVNSEHTFMHFSLQILAALDFMLTAVRILLLPVALPWMRIELLNGPELIGDFIVLSRQLIAILLLRKNRLGYGFSIFSSLMLSINIVSYFSIFKRIFPSILMGIIPLILNYLVLVPLGFIWICVGTLYVFLSSHMTYRWFVARKNAKRLFKTGINTNIKEQMEYLY